MLGQLWACCVLFFELARKQNWELTSRQLSHHDLSSYRQDSRSKYQRGFSVDMDAEVPRLPATGAAFVLFLALYCCSVPFWATVYPLFLLLRWASHARTPPSPLENWQRLALQPRVPAAMLDRLRVVGHTSWVAWLLTGDDEEAMAIEDDIYLARSSEQLTPSTLRHETVHCLQYRRYGGFVPFVSVYFSLQLAYMLYYRTSWFIAYLSNPLELEAYSLEKSWR